VLFRSHEPPGKEEGSKKKGGQFAHKPVGGTFPEDMVDPPRGTNTEVVAALDALPPDAVIRVYHGTTAAAAQAIVSSLWLKPDDVFAVGLAMDYDNASKYGRYHTGFGAGSRNAVVIEAAVQRSELGSADPGRGERWLREESGGSGENSVLVSGIRDDWKGIHLIAARVVQRKDARFNPHHEPAGKKDETGKPAGGRFAEDTTWVADPKQKTIDSLATGQIEDMRLLSASNGPRGNDLGRAHDRGDAITATIAGDQVFIKRGYDVNGEMGAYYVNRMLDGLVRIAPTTMRHDVDWEVQGDYVVVPPFVSPGQETLFGGPARQSTAPAVVSTFWDEGPPEDNSLGLNERELWDLALFDAVIANNDRHLDNILMGTYGACIAVDQGQAFMYDLEDNQAVQHLRDIADFYTHNQYSSSPEPYTPAVDWKMASDRQDEGDFYSAELKLAYRHRTLLKKLRTRLRSQSGRALLRPYVTSVQYRKMLARIDWMLQHGVILDGTNGP
jgi:hypothetical protein